MTRFLLCSDVKQNAGMELRRGLSSLSASEQAVRNAGQDKALLETSPVQIFRFFSDAVSKGEGSQPPRRFREKGRLKFERRERTITLLTPTEVRRRFGIVVDGDIPIGHAKTLAERQRAEFGRQAFLLGSNSITTDIENAVFAFALDRIDPLGRLIDKLDGRFGKRQVARHGLESAVPEQSTSLANQLESPQEPVAIKPRPSTELAERLASWPKNDRTKLLNGYAAALAEGRLPQHDQILFLMRLLDQDNKVNRRPPNARVDNHVRPSSAD